MRIAYFVVKHVAVGGGIERYTHELGRRLVARGHEVTVYSMKHYGDMPIEFEGMRIIGVPSIPSRCAEKVTASASAALYSLFRSRPDVAHFHSVASGAFAWISRLRDLPCVLQLHGIEWKRSRWGHIGSKVLKLLETSALRQIRTCTAVSKVQCEYFAEKYGIEPTHIPTGAEIKDRIMPQEITKLGLQPNSYILFASRLVREKGAHYLIPAFRRLDTDHKLVIAGDANRESGYKNELLQIAGNDRRIIFPGFVQGRLLEELFSNAIVFVQPSEIEGLSLSLLEAMSYGDICLVSDIPENIEAIGGAGYTFKNRSIGNLHDRLDCIIHNRGESAALGVKAKERIDKYYSWDKIAGQFEELYLSVLKKSQSIAVM